MTAKVVHRSSLVGAVAGSLDNLDGDLFEGDDFATVTLADGTVSHYILVAASSETADDKLFIAPAVNPGTKMWTMLSPFGANTHVDAVVDHVGFPMTPNVDNIIIYNSVSRDDLDEYDETTGIFTAKFDGTYLINQHNLCAQMAWAERDVLASKIGGTYNRWLQYNVIQTAITHYIGCQGSCTIRLSAGEVLYIEIKPVTALPNTWLQNDVGFNWLTIDRLI